MNQVSIPRSRFAALGCVFLAGCGWAAAGSAQVIEISDNGAATTYSEPTRFVTGERLGDVASEISVRPPDVDRYEQAARAEGLDVHLLRAVAWTESRGRQNAISPKGALGVMQLMPGTAAELGVDRFDPDANLHGGARYLARQLFRFRSVPLALAAYNAGPGAVMRWGGIPPFAETRAYVAQILSRYREVPGTRVPKPIVAIPLKPRTDAMLIEVPSL